MTISELIKNATDILVSQGDIFVNIELVDKENNSNRYNINGIEIQNRNSTSKETIAVIYTTTKNINNYK